MQLSIKCSRAHSRTKSKLYLLKQYLQTTKYHALKTTKCVTEYSSIIQSANIMTDTSPISALFGTFLGTELQLGWGKSMMLCVRAATLGYGGRRARRRVVLDCEKEVYV